MSSNKPINFFPEIGMIEKKQPRSLMAIIRRELLIYRIIIFALVAIDIIIFFAGRF